MTKKAKTAIIIAVIVALLGAIVFGVYYFIFREDEYNEVEQQIQEYREQKEQQWERKQYHLMEN